MGNQPEHYERKWALPVEEALEQFRKKYNKRGYRWPRRLNVYDKKGCKCVKCGIVGTIFAEERDKAGLRRNWHHNLYAVNKYGIETIMTIDHIVPKSKGGSNALNNLQPMCGPCNWKKGDTEST